MSSSSGSSDERRLPLEYNENAFYYFAGCILSITAVILTYKTIKRFIFGVRNTKKKQLTFLCKCETCTYLKDKYAHKGVSRITCGNIVMLMFTIVLWYLVVSSISNARQSEPAKQFDPYDILNVTANSTADEIKQSYRKLILLYHPDKSSDVDASAKFILTTKAYHALTDPVARRNYQLYGNPDGPSAMSIGIGLPKFLALKENRVSILLIFFIVLLVVLPVIALSMLGKYSKKNGLHLANDDIGWVLKFMTDQLAEKKMVEYFSLLKYWITLALDFGSEQNFEMNKIFKVISFPRNLQKNQTAMQINLLLNAHLQGVEIHDPVLKKNQGKVLKAFLKIIPVHT